MDRKDLWEEGTQASEEFRLQALHVSRLGKLSNNWFLWLSGGCLETAALCPAVAT